MEVNKGEEKKIEVVELKVSELNNQFGNPRRIDKKGLDSLQNSLDRLGDFGIIVIDENNSIIAGNQRVKVLKQKDPETKVLCKRLVGYSTAEKRAVNIKDNRHEGLDDLELLTEWVADLNLDLGIDPKKEEKEREGNTIEQLEPIRYEKYDYVLIACRSELDFNQLQDKLGLDKKKDLIVSRKGRRKLINCRAVWYDELPVEFVTKEEYSKTHPAEKEDGEL